MEPRPRFPDPATSSSNGGAAHTGGGSNGGAHNGKHAMPNAQGSTHAGASTARASAGEEACEPSLLASAGKLLEDLVVSGAALVEVYTDRVKLAMRKKLVAIALGAAGALCAMFLVGSASLAVMRGASGGFAELFGRPWAGDLVGGLFVLGLIGGGAVVGLRVSSRRELRRLEEKYERIRNQRERREDAHSQAENA